MAVLWMDRAECVGSWELFFPDHADPGPAKRICAGCGVRDQCLGHALVAGEPYGIWGGLTPGERRGRARRRPPEPREGGT
ncbi:WhiB family transcriptional regulator [Spirillospora sp. NPDC029432]|uniref:WhiB family transcriptional regulator n=1 Tax=Spirillospora sp. NPDC029432 TaxID=3154599 RepID=UPI0034572D7B